MLTLLDHSAEINTAPGSLGWTALHLCAIVNNEEGAEALLARGAALCEDVEGNTARMLAERAGHSKVVELLRDCGLPPAEFKGQLPPLNRPTEEAPEEQEPLESFEKEWQVRPSNDSVLDRIYGPMVHDAMLSHQWRDRWQAHSYISRTFPELSASPEDLVRAVSEATCMASRDKMPKVFLASLSVLDELLSDARVDEISADDFRSLLQSDHGDMIQLLLDQTDVGGGSSNATSPQQAAAASLCSCVLHGRISLDEAALPLLLRIEERLQTLAAKSDAKEAKTPKCLAANLKLLGRIITSFGLQQSGLCRRALVLPLLLRAAASEHSKVRAAAGDAFLQLLALSGGIEDRLWSLLPAKAQKRVQSLASGHEGIPLLSAVACDEDAMSKDDILAEDPRSSELVCVSELSPQVWAALQAGMNITKGATPKSPKAPNTDEVFADDMAADALSTAIASKNWKQRAESINKLFNDLATASEGVKLLKDSDEGTSGGPLLSQYVLGGLRISLLQAHLSSLLCDTVTAVFVNAADLLCLVCSQVPLYIAPLFLEPLLPALFGRLLDTIHEGLGDQNVRVYAEACMAVTAIVPSFCGTVDGRLLVAHLAPLLRQLCARMGDSKEVVRTQTTQAMFRLLSPPTGNIVSPVAIAMLILRHLMPSKEEDGLNDRPRRNPLPERPHHALAAPGEEGGSIVLLSNRPEGQGFH
eukprot:g12919.t1